MVVLFRDLAVPFAGPSSLSSAESSSACPSPTVSLNHRCKSGGLFVSRRRSDDERALFNEPGLSY